VQSEMLWAARTAVQTFALMNADIKRLSLAAVEG